ncbi:hypothetical protein RND81_04G059400 [Saponaria officinalis]|uniref:ATP-dependent DNA helicase n=1 Tax=Saponaria officinalis TaxID=3572 RepID=A0AAW1LCU8_SAPOF
MSQISSEMHPNVLRLLMRAIETNPHARFFSSLRDLGVQEWNRIVIRADPTHDRRTHNASTASQVAGIWVEDAPADSPLTQDIVVYTRSGASHRILHYYDCYDPLQYPILFPYGETGWHHCIYRRNVRRRPNQQVESFPINEVLVQTVDDLLYSEEQVAHTRDSDKKVSCRDYYCYRLHIRIHDTSILLHNQSVIRADLYQGIIDSYNAGETRSSNIDYRLILPATFLGCARDMHCRYLNSMGLIERELLPFEEAQNQPDLIARIFRSKLIKLKKDIVEKQLFGKVAGYVYVIEFKKGGLPHAHFLIILHSGHKIRNPESYDMHVCAQIPDEDRFPHLHAVVLKHMIHCPCGRNFPTNPCNAKNHYPREFSQFITNGRNSYPIYRRRNDSKTANVRGAQLDNRWVVPYNPFLLAKYDCHLNVEVCSTFKAVKYLYKYVYKGHDRVSFALTETDSPTAIDEISLYQSTRWTVTFRPHERLQNIADDCKQKTTMLTSFFAQNRIDPHARKLLYQQFPEQYSGFAIGRLVHINPSEGERHYLRLLLINVRGPLSFDDLLTASQYQLPFLLRLFFATLLIYCQPKCPRDLLDKFYSQLSEDFAVTFPSNPRKVLIMTLKSISSIIESMGKSFDSFDFGDGPGGTGKTFLYSTLLANLRSRGIIALVVASLGIVASNIARGRTKNSRFKIPLDTEEHLSNQILKQSGLAELIRGCRLIIWDEASMAKRQSIEHIERTLRDVCSCDTVFGGKIVVFGADFCQVLPVMLKSTRQEAVNAINMRAIHDPGFSDFALKVGNGSPPFENGEDIMCNTPICPSLGRYIMLPRQIVISADQNCSLMDKMISSVYPDISLINLDPFRTTKKAILTPKNKDADFINHMLVTKQVGQAFEYKSFDEAIDITTVQYPIEFLNTICPSGLPPHHLVLKKNSPIILLRNLDPNYSCLCNGTRIIYRALSRNVIEAEIVIGHHKGERVFIPRIPLQPSPSDKYPFNFRRKQFPVKLSFAMTINKAQGQTLDKLYVALSRANKSADVTVAGTEMNATLFDQNIDLFAGIFHMGKVYEITNPKIKPVPEEIIRGGHKYQMVIRPTTKVVKILSGFDNEETNIVPVNSMLQHVDETGRFATLTVWHDQLLQQAAHIDKLIAPIPVIHVTRIRASTFAELRTHIVAAAEGSSQEKQISNEEEEITISVKSITKQAVTELNECAPTYLFLCFNVMTIIFSTNIDTYHYQLVKRCVEVNLKIILNDILKQLHLSIAEFGIHAVVNDKLKA